MSEPVIPEQRLKQLAAAARMESLSRVLEIPPSLAEVSQLAAEVAEQAATIAKEESRSNELAKEVAILKVDLKGLAATIERLGNALSKAERFVDVHSEPWHVSGQQLLAEIRAASKQEPK